MCKRLSIAALGLVLLGATGVRAELQDPTRPPDFSAVEAVVGTAGAMGLPAGSRLTLQSILISPTRRIAIVNGERVKEGDEIGTARVVEIRAWGLELEDDEGPFELRFSSILVKTRVEDRAKQNEESP